MTVGALITPFWLIFLFSWGFGAFRTFRQPRVLGPYLLSALAVTVWAFTATTRLWYAFTLANKIEIIVWFVGAMVAAWQVMYLVFRIRPVAERVDALSRAEGPAVLHLKGEQRTYREELEKLLPLVEPLGYTPGWTAMTPAWLHGEMERAKADEPAARALAAVPESESIRQGKYSRKNGYLVRFEQQGS